MESIKPLSETVRSSVRSGFIICDLTRVVEELVYNSIDAGATRVSVSVSVQTGYVKVEDDGSGISREGLVLLGERYATSKFYNVADADGVSGRYGFLGEALCSISDVCLLEILTKTRGRPNGYRKVMKGRKCLFLGIDDDRRDVGTTVIVRELFYNQPVRRRHMQSCPKKVLHSVRKCALRVALVQSKISFMVVDVESEDVLLHTHASSSPFPLLRSNFGIGVSSLCEVSLSEGLLKLVGYASGPSDLSLTKGIQYIYINSRFIVKGPIHKLLNHLANSCWDQLTGDRAGKRSRPQACPTYYLNLTCPRSLYDLHLESSRTSVEFKDWAVILAFFEKSIASLWSSNVFEGEHVSPATSHLGKDGQVEDENDWWEAFGSSKKRCMKPNNKNQQASRACDLLPIEMRTKESLWQGCSRASKRLQRNTVRTKEPETEEFSDQMDYLESCGHSLSSSAFNAEEDNYNHLWETNNEFISANKDFWEKDISVRNKEKSKYEFLKLEDAHTESDKAAGSMRNNHRFGYVSERKKAIMSPALRKRSFQGNVYETLFTHSKRFKFQSGHFRTESYSDSDVRVSVVDFNDLHQNFDIFKRTLWQNEMEVNCPYLDLKAESDLHKDLDVICRKSQYSILFPGECSSEVEDTSDSSAQGGALGSLMTSDPYSMISDPFYDIKLWDHECLVHEGLERSSQSRTCPKFEHVKDKGDDFHFDNFSGYENLSCRGFSNSSLLKASYPGFKRGLCRCFRHGHSLGATSSTSSTCYDGILTEETNSQCFDLCAEDHMSLASASWGPFDSKGPIVDLQRHQAPAQNHGLRARSRRSQSAPPSYEGKRRFLSINDCLTVTAENTDVKALHNVHIAGDRGELEQRKGMQLSSVEYHQYPRMSFEDPPFCVEQKMNATLSFVTDDAETCNKQLLESPDCNHGHSVMEFQDSRNLLWVKWRNGSPNTRLEQPSGFEDGGDISKKVQDECTILDISSGILHLACDSLVPNSVDRNFLENCKVLLQVDKKFIPVVGGGTLAVIDQHAADERIRLEELRQKVLSGQMKSISYLEAEKELVLPETAYQLLYSYAEPIQEWGWICSIYAEGSRPFKKNLNLLHGQPTCVSLLAVPCILGVRLSDKDLLEYLQQLADTDGSSTTPPAVLRVLNFKACRGAIMFGDALLPSECSLIVDELKQTSLCFQCAHGRPTTVPLVNLDALKKQIIKFGLQNGDSNETWHGLCRREINLKRSEQRLNSTRGGSD
ncbi:hypothetical protein Ancab_026690 [Ancistrocladus abbreviatus]